MRYGFRTPSFKRSISAATKGAAKRALMREIVPNYDKRGMGWANPKKAAYNRVYNMTTANSFDIFTNKRDRKNYSHALSSHQTQSHNTSPSSNKRTKDLPIWQRVLLVIGLIVGAVGVIYLIVALISASFPLLIALLFLIGFLLNGK